MPIHSVIDKERRLVITPGEGRITFVDSIANQDRLLSDPDFTSEFNQLFDATRVSVIDHSVDQVRKVASRRLFSPRSRRAFVAADTLTYGMGRILQIYLELSQNPSQSQIFNDWDAAWHWLAIKGS